MISYKRNVLPNGLVVIVHEDKSTPLVAVNLLYKVGSKFENPEKTGFAHLFEHLMFSGTENVASFDSVIQKAGGECNAFTNSDVTNFYCLLPKENLEVALALEADRMANLEVSDRALEVQRKVVVEEFYETCLDAPYGDLWHHIMGSAFAGTNYAWPTIGKVPEHIDRATHSDVTAFFDKWYGPNNAVLVLSGNVNAETGFALVEKYFGGIERCTLPAKAVVKPIAQSSIRSETVKKDVPADVLVFAFHMVGRNHPDYFALDLLSDILSNGPSSRFAQNLEKNPGLFTNADCYLTGTHDSGLVIVEGQPAPGVSIEDAEKALWLELEKMQVSPVEDRELEKIKNKAESSTAFAEYGIQNKAIGLAFYESMGNLPLINSELEKYRSVSAEDIQHMAKQTFRKENCAHLQYLKA